WGRLRHRDYRRRPAGARTSYDDTFRRLRTYCRRERSTELSPRSDAELREYPVQVGADRAVREVEPLPDLAVRQALRRKLGDLQFLRRQLIARLGQASTAALPRGAHLPSRLLAPSRAPECVERVPRGPQHAPGFGDTPVPSEPLSVCELKPRPLKRPARQV